jgi:predicted dehydrogenase
LAARVGLASVGVGWWGGYLAERAGAGGQAVITTCYARNPDKREAFAARFDCRVSESFDDVLKSSDVDGVLIATSHTSHRQFIEEAAAAGKHVFVEKPMTLTLEDARASVAAAEEAGIILQVGHQRRRTPANRRIKELLDTGTLGEVQVISSHHHSPNGMRMPGEAWRRRPEESPLGSMTSLAVHSLDTFLYLGGPMRRVFTSTRPAGPGGTIDQATALTIEFTTGVLGSILTSFYVPGLVELSVHGSAAAAFSREDGKSLLLNRLEPPGTEQLDLPTLDPVEEELSEFVAAILGEATPETGGREGMAVVAALEAAVESSRSGCAVEIAI